MSTAGRHAGNRFEDMAQITIKYNDKLICYAKVSWLAPVKVRRLIIAGNVPRIYLENPDYNWDLSVPAKVEYDGIKNTPEEMAELYKRCDVLLYPSFAEACPNTVAEALACGLDIRGVNAVGGTKELIGHQKMFYNYHQKFWDIYDMANKYLQLIEKL